MELVRDNIINEVFRAIAMVILQFSPEDRVTLGEFTGRHVGEAVELRVCGEVLSAPVVQEAITGGKLVLSGDDVWGKMADFLANGCP